MATTATTVRGEILALVVTGINAGLPAPRTVTFATDPALIFDRVDEAEAWADNFGMGASVPVRDDLTWSGSVLIDVAPYDVPVRLVARADA